jgi:SAM-dependent methyltransferase
LNGFLKTNSLNGGASCPLAAPRLYETDALRQATGDTLRPGGLALLLEALQQVNWPSGARVLDIGCGIGTTAAYLRRVHGLRAMGLDLSAQLLGEGTARHPGLPLLRGRAEALPIADGVLAGLTCECVLSLICDPAGALREFHRVLKPGGRLILSDLYRRRDLERGALPGNCCLAGAVSREKLFDCLQGAGFKVRLWQDRSHLLAELAARLVLLHGSMTSFWGRFTDDGDGRAMQQAVQAIRPGYFLLIAQKSSASR